MEIINSASPSKPYPQRKWIISSEDVAGSYCSAQIKPTILKSTLIDRYWKGWKTFSREKQNELLSHIKDYVRCRKRLQINRNYLMYLLIWSNEMKRIYCTTFLWEREQFSFWSRAIRRNISLLKVLWEIVLT